MSTPIPGLGFRLEFDTQRVDDIRDTRCETRLEGCDETSFRSRKRRTISGDGYNKCRRRRPSSTVLERGGDGIQVLVRVGEFEPDLDRLASRIAQQVGRTPPPLVRHLVRA